RDPELTTLVLRELVNRYFVKHLEVHRSAGAFDFVTEQTDQVRTRLNQTEDALKPLKEQMGIISLADGKTAWSADLTKTEAQLHAAEAELAEQQAKVKDLAESSSGVTVRPKGGGSKHKSESAANGNQPSIGGDDNLKPSPGPTDLPSAEQIQQYEA